MFDLNKALESKFDQLGELLDISDGFARGEGEPKPHQFNFLKLSIDARLRALERLLPLKTEQSGELLLRIASDEKGVYLESSQVPASMPSATSAV